MRGRPRQPEEVRAAEERLRQLDRKSVEREAARTAVAEAGAALHDVLARFNPEGEPPRLDADAFRRAEAVAGPLIARATAPPRAAGAA